MTNPPALLQASLWSPIRLAYGLLPCITLLERENVDTDKLLERANIDRFGLLDPAYSISIDQEITFMRAAIERMSPRAWSLALAQQYRLRGFSVLGLAMQASTSALDMLKLVMRFPRLAWGFFDAQIHASGDQFRLEFLPQPRLGRSEGFLAERDFACALVLIREATQHTVSPVRISFRHPAPDDLRPYEDFFGCPVQFDAPRNEALIPQSIALHPLPLADPRMCAFYMAQCERMSQSMEQPFQVQDAVRARLLDARPIPDLPQLAASMFLSPRTLQRRLAAENARYSELLRDARRQRARQLLEGTARDMHSIAAELGFTDAVAFSHAFKSWFGQAPRDWRRAQNRAT